MLTGRAFDRALRVFEVFIAVTLLLLLCELGARVAISMADPTRYGNRELDAKFQLASTKMPDRLPTILFIGSSFTLNGVYPEFLVAKLRAKEINVDALNLACPVAFVENQYRLLKMAMDSGIKPRAVFYEVTPVALADLYKLDQWENTLLSESYWGFRLNPKPGLPAAIENFAKEHFYLVRYRAFFKNLILRNLASTLLTPDKAVVKPLEDRVYVDISAKGWSPCYGASDEFFRKSMIKRRRYFQTKKNITAANVSDTMRKIAPMVDLCRKNHVPFALIWYPCRVETQVVYKEFLGADCDMLAKLIAKAAKEQSVPFIDWHRFLEHNPEYFFDCDHLNAAGAVELTRRLSELIESNPDCDFAKMQP